MRGKKGSGQTYRFARVNFGKVILEPGDGPVELTVDDVVLDLLVGRLDDEPDSGFHFGGKICVAAKSERRQKRWLKQLDETHLTLDSLLRLTRKVPIMVARSHKHSSHMNLSTIDKETRKLVCVPQTLNTNTVKDPEFKSPVCIYSIGQDGSVFGDL